MLVFVQSMASYFHITLWMTKYHTIARTDTLHLVLACQFAFDLAVKWRFVVSQSGIFEMGYNLLAWLSSLRYEENICHRNTLNSTNMPNF
jgi:hypothetical protein